MGSWGHEELDPSLVGPCCDPEKPSHLCEPPVSNKLAAKALVSIWGLGQYPPVPQSAIGHYSPIT